MERTRGGGRSARRRKVVPRRVRARARAAGGKAQLCVGRAREIHGPVDAAWGAEGSAGAAVRRSAGWAGRGRARRGARAAAVEGPLGRAAAARAAGSECGGADARRSSSCCSCCRRRRNLDPRAPDTPASPW